MRLTLELRDWTQHGILCQALGLMEKRGKEDNYPTVVRDVQDILMQMGEQFDSLVAQRIAERRQSGYEELPRSPKQEEEG